jgi:hypothetical protein|tara:strand:+ start:4843 stop:5121 length:279 start_codon:yes stop_codon:yes gene_type:complete
MAKELVYDALLKKEVEIEVDNQEDPNLEQNIINAKKATRNTLLKNSDWTMVTDSKLSDEQTVEVTHYRQVLRDLPDQEGFPNIDFPTKPDFI